MIWLAVGVAKARVEGGEKRSKFMANFSIHRSHILAMEQTKGRLGYLHRLPACTHSLRARTKINTMVRDRPA